MRSIAYHHKMWERASKINVIKSDGHRAMNIILFFHCHEFHLIETGRSKWKQTLIIRKSINHLFFFRIIERVLFLNDSIFSGKVEKSSRLKIKFDFSVTFYFTLRSLSLSLFVQVTCSLYCFPVPCPHILPVLTPGSGVSLNINYSSRRQINEVSTASKSCVILEVY